MGKPQQQATPEPVEPAVPVVEPDVDVEYVEPLEPGWVELRHPETGGVTKVPDAPGVVRSHQGRGWVVIDQDNPGTDPDPDDAPDDEPPAAEPGNNPQPATEPTEPKE